MSLWDKLTSWTSEPMFPEGWMQSPYFYTHPSSDDVGSPKCYLRRGTAADWFKYDPVLLLNEIVYTKDTGAIKVGNGVSRWSELPPR